MSEIIKVGMADLKTCLPPNGITTLGLGCAVGIALRAKVNKVCGLAHIMLPDSTVIANQTNLAKFADTGIDELIRQMEALGARRINMAAKIAGGAMMFAVSSRSSLNVGERNVEAVRKKLKSLGIPILAEDCGLNFGRTVVFYPETGDYIIKAVGKPEKTI